MNGKPLLALRLAMMCACLVLAGCGSRVSTVSGNVTYKGERLTRGQISFVAPDGEPPVSSTIHADGAYEVTNVPRGQVIVVVSSMGAEGEATLGFKLLKTPPKRFSLIPLRYNSAETSPLKFTINESSQRIEIELTD
jgi:hypothetical protein